MATDATKTILLVGGLGAGAYLFYEYMQYNNAINALANGNQTQISAAQTALPFFNYLGMLWGGAASGTATQQSIFQLIQSYLTGGTAAATQTQAPGTTSTTQPTSVSTVPGTTPTVNASTAPTTVTPAPPPPAPQPVSRVPIVSSRPGLALQMQQKINMTIANADQWNYAYNQIMGQGIDAQYGLNFDHVYGAVVNGARSSGTMSAQSFLQLAASAVPGGLGGGLSTIAQYAGPALATQGNLIYQAHHPFPYVPTYSLRGLGAVTEASGFEKTLFAGRALRSPRIR
jgi:hypothetical protein